MDVSLQGLALAAAVTVVLLQATDVVLGLIGARSLAAAPVSTSRVRRSHDAIVAGVWACLLAAVGSIAVAAAVSALLAQLHRGGSPVVAVAGLAVTALAVLGFLALALALAIAVRPRGYVEIRRDLRDRDSPRFSRAEIDRLRARVAAVDRARRRPVRASAALRVAGLLVVLSSVVAVQMSDAPVTSGRSLLAAALIILSVVLTIAAARASRTRFALREAQLESDRTQLLELLERAKIPRIAGTPGLRERVTTALAILREQQRSVPRGDRS